MTAHESLVAVHEIGTERISEQSEEGVRLQESTRTVDQRLRPLNAHEIAVKQSTERIVNESRPTSRSLVQGTGRQTLIDEVEDVDPVFGWSGGHPYGSNRPTLILHCAESDDQIRSFAFLQRTLRDAYTELEGGEPTVENVEFVANEVQIPNVGGRIVTIDATEGEWSPSFDDGQPSIERSGVDIVSALTDHSETLYSGRLGYLVVNVPSAWESTFRRKNFFDQLVETLADAAPSTGGEDVGAFEKLRSAPISVARPRVTDPDAFAARVARYFGFEYAPEYETIAQIDESFVAGLRSNRWAKISLAERQSYGDESSRHYNWKALVAEGLARALWTTTTDREQPFDSFIRERLLPDGPLATESVLSGGPADEDSVIADIHLGAYNDGNRWLPDKLPEFVDDDLYELPLVVEFETGFSEAAFGYRKLVESIRKYDVTGFEGTLLVVVPPRLLYRGQRQARHLDRLVESQEEQFDGLSTALCVPTVSEGRCTGLQQASTLITRLYDDV